MIRLDEYLFHCKTGSRLRNSSERYFVLSSIKNSHFLIKLLFFGKGSIQIKFYDLGFYGLCCPSYPIVVWDLNGHLERRFLLIFSYFQEAIFLLHLALKTAQHKFSIIKNKLIVFISLTNGILLVSSNKNYIFCQFDKCSVERTTLQLIH